MKMWIQLLLAVGAVACAAGCGKAPVSVATEAERLADPLSIARLDGRDTVLHSSWDRSGGNDDWGTFLRDSAESGWKVVADLQGPGVLTRFWFTGAKDGKPFRFRFFFDGEAVPRFEGDVKEWCGGGLEPFVAPLAEYANYCWYSFVPMPYAKGLRVECEAGPEGAKPYYQLSETKLPQGTMVESFRWPLGEGDLVALGRLREVWLEGFPEGEGRETVEAVLTAGAPALKLEGRGVVRRIGFEPDWGAVPEGERDAVLREMRVGIRCDGAQEESVWAPLGDLCGMPWRRVRAKSLWFGMEGEELFCAFPMPFADGLEVRVDFGRFGKVPVRVRAAREAVGRRELKGLGRFHAAWKRTGLKEVGAPHPILRVRGEGKYVGCLLAVCTLDGSYWALEGDESIRKDAEAAPGWRGTGLEDYFNGGWYYQNVLAGPTHGLFVKEPFRTVQYRVHAMDPSGFAESLDMEFERGPDHVSHAFFESTAWYYMKEAGRTDSMRLAPGYRKTPQDPRLDRFNAMTAAWNAERFGDWRGARDEWALRLAAEGKGWPAAARRMGELRLALYGERLGEGSADGAVEACLADPDEGVRHTAGVLKKERDGEAVTALLWANMPAELFIDGECVLRAESPSSAAVESVAVEPGAHVVAIRTALQSYPDWVLLALRKGDWFAGTEADWKCAINPPEDSVEAGFDDGGWAAMQGTGVKGPPEEPYVEVAPDPWIGMQSRAVGVRPTGDKPAEGTAVYRAVITFP